MRIVIFFKKYKIKSIVDRTKYTTMPIVLLMFKGNISRLDYTFLVAGLSLYPLNIPGFLIFSVGIERDMKVV